MSKKYKSMDEIMGEVGPGDITPSVDAGEQDFLARQAKYKAELDAFVEPVVEPLADTASVAPLELKDNVITSANPPSDAPKLVDVEGALKAAADLAGALAHRCADGGRADLGDLRKLERDIRALAVV
jgi:hypothetical protein